jgi:hypothetical protein
MIFMAPNSLSLPTNILTCGGGCSIAGAPDSLLRPTDTFLLGGGPMYAALDSTLEDIPNSTEGGAMVGFITWL